MYENKEGVREGVLTWAAPRGVAASEGVSKEERIDYYLATEETTLRDGTRVVSSRETVEMILVCWDMFGVEVAISFDSYEERR